MHNADGKLVGGYQAGQVDFTQTDSQQAGKNQ